MCDEEKEKRREFLETLQETQRRGFGESERSTEEEGVDGLRLLRNSRSSSRSMHQIGAAAFSRKIPMAYVRFRSFREISPFLLKDVTPVEEMGSRSLTRDTRGISNDPISRYSKFQRVEETCSHQCETRMKSFGEELSHQRQKKRNEEKRFGRRETQRRGFAEPKRLSIEIVHREVA